MQITHGWPVGLGQVFYESRETRGNPDVDHGSHRYLFRIVISALIHLSKGIREHEREVDTEQSPHGSCVVRASPAPKKGLMSWGTGVRKQTFPLACIAVGGQQRAPI